MRLRGAATQQIDQSRVEGHYGVSHVDDIIIFIIKHVTKSAGQNKTQLYEWEWEKQNKTET